MQGNRFVRSNTPAPAVQRAVREAADILRKQGAQVTAWTPPDASHGMELLYGIFGADGCRLMAAMLGKDRRAPQIAQLLMMANLPRWLIRALMMLLNDVGQCGMAKRLTSG